MMWQAHGWPPVWQIREVLETVALLHGGLVVPKTGDGDAKNVRSLLVSMWLSGLVTWLDPSADNWIFKITDDGRAALSEATRDSALMTEWSRVTESAEAFRRDQPQ
jgi:hypothetical protein